MRVTKGRMRVTERAERQTHPLQGCHSPQPCNTVFSDVRAAWQCFAQAGTGAQSSENSELTKTRQASWPACCGGTPSLSLSTMPLQHVGHEEEVALNHSSALESRSKPSLPPPGKPDLSTLYCYPSARNRIIFPKIVASNSPLAASILRFISISSHTTLALKEYNSLSRPDVVSTPQPLLFIKIAGQLITPRATQKVYVSHCCTCLTAHFWLLLFQLHHCIGMKNPLASWITGISILLLSDKSFEAHVVNFTGIRLFLLVTLNGRAYL